MAILYTPEFKTNNRHINQLRIQFSADLAHIS